MHLLVMFSCLVYISYVFFITWMQSSLDKFQDQILFGNIILLGISKDDDDDVVVIIIIIINM